MQASVAPTTPDDVSLLVAMARRRLKQAVSGRLTQFNLGPQQFWILLTLAENEGLSLHEVAQRTWTDDPTACRIVAKLGERGLVKSSEDPADRRRFRLVLTAKGRKLTNDLESFAGEIRTTVVKGLSPGDRKHLCGLLKRVIVNMDLLDGPQSGSNGASRRKKR